MTLLTGDAKIQYDGDGAQTAFPIPFPFLAAADIQAVLRDGAGAETTLSEGPDFTVSGGGGGAGTLSASSAPAAGETLTIRRAVPLTQDTDYPEGGAFPAQSHENALDKLTMADQQQQEQLDRSVRFPVSDPVALGAELPSSVDRAGKFAAYDMAGAPIAAAGGVGPDPVPVTPFMATVLDDADAGTARTTLGATAIGGQVFTAADAAAIRALIDAPQSNQGFTTGDVKLTVKTAADAGWVMMDDGTIGSAASGATTRADADTEDLFKLLWDNVADAWAPVSGGRGASADADWTGDKTIALPKALGRALAVSGAGSGLTSRALGEVLGEETHTLTEAESAAHTHYTVKSGTTVAAGLGDLTTSEVVEQGRESGGQTAYVLHGVSGSANVGLSSSSGGDSAHNNMQPSAFFNVMVKL